MEYALRVNLVQSTYLNKDVLILVLMEYALRALFIVILMFGGASLNPCFNGICSARGGYCQHPEHNDGVLILVLMEYALRDKRLSYFRIRQNSLNPCFNGICSASYAVELYKEGNL